MRLSIQLALIVGVLFAGSSQDAFAQKKSPAVPATAVDYENLKDTKYLVGTLIAFDELNHTMTVRVEVPHLEPNPSYRPPDYQAKAKAQATAQLRQLQEQQRRQVQQQQTLARLQARVMQARTPQQRQQAMVNLAREIARMQQRQAQDAGRQRAQNIRDANTAAQNAINAAKNPNSNPYKVVTVGKQYDFDVADKVVIRKMFLATEFDDTGNYKEYTEREKADLRGDDPTKPGYAAKAENLFPSQELKLYLVPAKSAKNEVRPDDEIGGPINRPVVTMIVMTREN